MSELKGSGKESNERRGSELDVTELKAAYSSTGLDEFFSELTHEAWQSILEGASPPMPNAAYYLDSGPDFDAVVFPGTPRGDLVVKRPATGLTTYQSEDEVRTILHHRAYAATLVADLPHFEKGVAFSSSDLAIVTEFVEGRNLADFSDEEIRALSYPKLHNFAQAYLEGRKRGVAMGMDSAANFVDNSREIVCVGYELLDDASDTSPAAGWYAFAERIASSVRVGERPDLTARRSFLERMRVISEINFPEDRELHQQLASEEERLQSTPWDRW